ncbi:endonuclease/exonuclease/phosphatase family protein [Streptomyces malaysiensis]|uniref:Endonuclease/exonuclease/phosphatase family protein n=1 Tax=Streptomyces malaysiensis subsp. samsunensis TaxID=459658 RepID=A0A9X2RUD4_STRMQ|nr:endonuclease/exonuclease/phosphatase family protein [Streptomyces samsunensis]MCQ8831356.1 endonuclease/exonuclease/phosphatase family protein [Streptomyces samsunensis]
MPAPVFSRRRGMRVAAAAAVALPLAAQPQYVATAVPAAPVAPADGPRLAAMTFNLRYASDSEPNSWGRRRPVMRELLRRARPHLLGTQEGLYGQLRDIAQDLGQRYSWIGVGRMGGSRDEFMAVFYDTGRLEPLEYDHFWLSDTPNVIGSNTWGGAVVRMVTWVRFHDRHTGKEFYALNTHLDHRSQNAREHAAALITERLDGLDSALPRIVTGDFNVAAHGNPVYDAMLNGGTLVDTWDTAERRGPLYGTFHGFGPLTPDGDRIDWILTSPGVRTRHAAIDTFSQDTQYPSDHLPVRTVLEL